MFCKQTTCFPRARSHARSAARSRAGFSLVELMVVVVIIGLLAGAVSMSVRSYLIRGKRNVAKLEIAKICEAIDTYYSEFDKFPSNDEGLAALIEQTRTFPDGLLSKVPTDPWGNAYQYNHPGRNRPYEVICYGAGGREGGENAEADISSDDLNDA